MVVTLLRVKPYHLMRAAISQSMEQSTYGRIISPAVAIWVITVFNMLAYIYLSQFNFQAQHDKEILLDGKEGGGK